MKIRSEEQSFHTQRAFAFAGKEVGNIGTVKIEITCRGIVTGEMARKLDELAGEAQKKAKEIVEGQEAQQQIYEA